ncbi:MAG: hypothetical protein QXP01_04125 [Candidatus Hadarchaeum sp.]
MTGKSETTQGVAGLDLRIVETAKIIPHEIADEQRSTQLASLLRRDKVLKNPPIVAVLDETKGTFVILDGTNRVTALATLGVHHALVQVVNYGPPQVELHTWHHVVTDILSWDLILSFERIAGLEIHITGLAQARQAMEAGEILAYGALYDGRAFILKDNLDDACQRARLLNEIVGVYTRHGHLNRAATNDLGQLFRLYPDLICVMTFAEYKPADVIELARNGLHAPAGVTRHLIQGRALRVNYPLDRLQAPGSLAKKNHELIEWISFRFKQRHVRYYAEAVYLFDE